MNRNEKNCRLFRADRSRIDADSEIARTAGLQRAEMKFPEQRLRDDKSVRTTGSHRSDSVLRAASASRSGPESGRRVRYASGTVSTDVRTPRMYPVPDNVTVTSAA